MVEARAEFFIDERGVAPVNDVPQKRVRFVEAHHVLLLHEVVESLVELSGQAEGVDQPVHHPHRAIQAVGLPEKLRKLDRSGAEGPLAGHLYLLARFYGNAEFSRLGAEFPDHATALGTDYLQPFLGESLRVLHAALLGKFAMLLAFKHLAHLVQGILDVEAPPLLETVRNAGLEPGEKFGLVLRQGVQDAVHGLFYQGIAVQLHLIIRKLPYLP